MPDLPFQGALKIRGNFTRIFNTDTLTEVTDPPIGENEKFPERLITMSPHPKISEDSSKVLSCFDKYVTMNQDPKIISDKLPATDLADSD